MDFKKATLRSIVIIAIIAVSVIIGVLYQKVSTSIDKVNYPQEFKDSVEKYSDEFGVPEYVIYAVIKDKSNFQSGILSEDGKIGLMQVEPATLEEYKGSLKDNYDTGMLYDPDTNIKYGTYKLSKMYIKLGTWNAVYAAMVVGEDTVEEWLADKNISDIGENTKPTLRDIPDKDAENYVKKLGKVADTYKSLYFEN